MASGTRRPATQRDKPAAPRLVPTQPVGPRLCLEIAPRILGDRFVQPASLRRAILHHAEFVHVEKACPSPALPLRTSARDQLRSVVVIKISLRRAIDVESRPQVLVDGAGASWRSSWCGSCCRCGGSGSTARGCT